ncbi:MAG TPA: hypothetical protein DEU95_14655, partial [Chloroflexi bacterium]|nr:hypothetical protein [Chloroflexota bacterium]HCG30906.1 hypothetical protein [Chloroflexota bacterium]
MDFVSDDSGKTAHTASAIGVGMSARILLTCWPFPGHVFPHMSIALALRERGCEVALYTAEESRDVVEAAGIRFFPFKAVRSERWERIHELEERAGG